MLNAKVVLEKTSKKHMMHMQKKKKPQSIASIGSDPSSRSKMMEILKHFLFTLILVGIFLMVQSIDQFPVIGVVSHWTWIIASPALVVYLISSLLMPGGDRDCGFLTVVWISAAIPVSGWIFFLMAMAAMVIFQPILELMQTLGKKHAHLKA